MYHCDDENFENEVIIMNLNNFIPLNRKLSLQEMPAHNS